jgi:hypothetical protein
MEKQQEELKPAKTKKDTRQIRSVGKIKPTHL